AEEAAEEGSEALEERRLAVAVADVRAQLRIRRAEEISDGAVARVGVGRRRETDACVGRARRRREARHAQMKGLRAESGGELQTVFEEAQLILREEGVAAFAHVNRGVARGRHVERTVQVALALELVSGGD